MIFRQITSGEPFLQAQDGDINKILSFQLLRISITCVMQTEYTVMELSILRPNMFDSIFTIHEFVGSAMFPLVFSQRHIRLFTLLQEICRRHNQTLSPTSVSLDFVCASTYCSSRDFPHSGTQRLPVPLMQGYMEEDPGMWSTKRLQNPT